MEPDIMRLHPSSPPPLDDDDEEEEEVGSEKDEFGDIRGRSPVVSCSPLGFADFIEPSLSLTQPCPAIKPATHQPYTCFNHPVKQSQPASTMTSGSRMVQMNMEDHDCNAEPPLHLTNGYAERDHTSGPHYSFSIVGTCSPIGETGFADFTVFTEQTTLPWCCGFSPISSTEQWDVRVEGTNLVKQICDPGLEVITDSEPKSHCAQGANEKICTEVKDSDGRGCHPQEAAAVLVVGPADTHHGEEGEGKPRDSWSDSGHCQRCSSLQISESEEEKSVCNVPQTFSAYESALEDTASFCDELSFECVSADLEPNVSSLTSQENQCDWDKTDDEDEEQGNGRHADSVVTFSIANLRQTETEKGFHHCNQSATQETPATSTFFGGQSHLSDDEDESLDFTYGQLKHYSDQEHVQTADVKVLCLGSLPPSDSFADFCSAPAQGGGDGDGLWAEFKDQRAEQDKTWTHFREQDSSLPTGGDSEEEQDWAGKYGAFGGNSCQAPLSCRVQQLLQAGFPDRVVPTVYSEEEFLSLDTLFHIQSLPDSVKEEKAESSSAPWIKESVWWPHQDLHSSVGLQFQWGGSHTNRTLLRCLGVDTRNMGLIEPAKDSVLAVASPRDTAQTSPGPQRMMEPSTDSIQGPLPVSQLNRGSCGLSSSQDGLSPWK